MMTLSPQQLVQDYLDDLDRALAAAGPGERKEALTSAREYLTQALGEDATTADVRRAIAALGPADEVAAAAIGPGPLADGHRALDLLPAAPLAAAIGLVLAPGPLTYIGAVWAVISLVTSTIVLIRSRKRQHRIWATVTLALAVVVLAVVVPLIVRPFM